MTLYEKPSAPSANTVIFVNIAKRSSKQNQLHVRSILGTMFTAPLALRLCAQEENQFKMVTQIVSITI